MKSIDRNKSLRCVLCALCLILLSFDISAEDFSKILQGYGKPIERYEYESARKIVWKYPRRDFVFIDGILQTDQTPVKKIAERSVPKNQQPAVTVPLLNSNPNVLRPKTPTPDLMREVFNEVHGKSQDSLAPGKPADTKDLRRPPGRMPTLPLLPVDSEEEEEEEIG